MYLKMYKSETPAAATTGVSAQFTVEHPFWADAVYASLSNHLQI